MSINIGAILQGGILSLIPLLVPNSDALIQDVKDAVNKGANADAIKQLVHDAIKLAENYTPDKIDAVLEAFDTFFDAGVDLEQAIVSATKQ